MTSIRFEDVLFRKCWLKGGATNRKDFLMKRVLFALAFLLPLPLASANADTGLAQLNVPAPHHGRDMEVGIMFPSDGGTETIFGENPVFYGIPVHENAKPAAGKHPLILLSHGWGGNYARLGWLGAGLVEKGAVVVAVNHPNSTTGDLNKTSALNHWTRAQDLSLALDHVLNDPVFAEIIDTKRIYSAGFSYGGWTALSLAGLKGRAEGYGPYCKAAGDGSTHCRELKNMGIKISETDTDKWHASYKDKRVAAAAAIDPALTWGLAPDDTADLNGPVLLIGLGEGNDRLAATDTSAAGSNFEALFPAAKVERIVPATHFTALGRCKPKGAVILEEEKDDPVCTDPAGTDRSAVAAKIVDLIAKHFQLN
jgi:predicted dienelactone hydrolase